MNKKNIIVASLLGVLLTVGVVSASFGGLFEQIADRTGYHLANILALKVESSGESVDGFLGSAGDTYQSSKVYSKVIASGSTIPANIPCAGWLIKGLDFYVAPSSTATATTTITLGITANSTTTTVETSLATDTFSTSTAVYQTYVQADGAGQTCASGKYVSAVFGAAATTTSGVLNVEYIIYQ